MGKRPAGEKEELFPQIGPSGVNRFHSVYWHSFSAFPSKNTMLLRLTSGLACLFLLLSCQEPASRTPANPAQGADTGANKTMQTATAAPALAPDSTVLQGDWYLQAMLPSDTAAGKLPMIHFDLKKSRFNGNTGCNNMSGKFWFSANDSSLSFSDKLITTRMACTGYNEKAFLKSLVATVRYKLIDGQLIFLSEENQELSHWGRKPASPLKPLKA